MNAEFVCPVEDCGAAYSTKEQRSTHKSHKHRRDWVPTRCDFPGCTNTTTFTSQEGLRRHRNTHFGKYPTTCLVPGCTQTQKFAENTYYEHLLKYHSLTNAAARAPFLPTTDEEIVTTWDERNCPIENYKFKRTWKWRSQLKFQLEKDQHLTGYQVKQILKSFEVQMRADEARKAKKATNAHHRELAKGEKIVTVWNEGNCPFENIKSSEVTWKYISKLKAHLEQAHHHLSEEGVKQILGSFEVQITADERKRAKKAKKRPIADEDTTASSTKKSKGT